MVILFFLVRISSLFPLLVLFLLFAFRIIGSILTFVVEFLYFLIKCYSKQNAFDI